MAGHISYSSPYHQVYWNTISLKEIRFALLEDRCFGDEDEFHVVKR